MTGKPLAVLTVVVVVAAMALGACTSRTSTPTKTASQGRGVGFERVVPADGRSPSDGLRRRLRRTYIDGDHQIGHVLAALPASLRGPAGERPPFHKALSFEFVD
jgi:hypothetical protein